MNYTELQAAALGDTHKENYASEIVRFIQQGEALIRSKLEAFGLTYVFDESDRVAAESQVYTLPDDVILPRYLRLADGSPLIKVDDTTIVQRKSESSVCYFCLRPQHIVFAGTPAADTEITMDYLGIPPALSDAEPTNALLTRFPQIYIEATAVYIFKRAQDYESAQVAQDSCIGMINGINKQMKKLLGGAQSANVYNVDCRSSY